MNWLILFFNVGDSERTTCRWRSLSVRWLYQGSSRSGDHCQAYFRTVLITALLIKMHKYTIRKAFIDLQRQRVGIVLWEMNQRKNSKSFSERILVILFYSGALLRFRLVIQRHLCLHASVDCNPCRERNAAIMTNTPSYQPFLNTNNCPESLSRLNLYGTTINMLCVLQCGSSKEQVLSPKWSARMDEIQELFI